MIDAVIDYAFFVIIDYTHPVYIYYSLFHISLKMTVFIANEAIIIALSIDYVKS